MKVAVFGVIPNWSAMLGAAIIFLTIILMTFLTEEIVARAFKRLMLHVQGNKTAKNDVEKSKEETVGEIPPWPVGDQEQGEIQHRTVGDNEMGEARLKTVGDMEGNKLSPFTIENQEQGDILDKK